MKRKLIGGLAGALVAGLALVGATVTPASAAGVSKLSGPNGSKVPVYYLPNTQYSRVEIWDKSGTKFQMRCWLDNAGHRWFYGQEFSRGYWGYVTAGNVANQITVGRC